MKLWLGLLVLFTAAAISCVAAYFSVVGLVALFAASAVPVMIMGGTLEFAKLVGSGWLKLNWTNPNTNRLHRWVLTGFVVSLMVITSIGIYGFLMAAHLEQSAPRADLGVQSEQLQLQVDQRNQENQRIQQRMGQIDQNIAVFLQNDQASRGLKASQSLQKERDRLGSQLEVNNQTINQLQTKLAPLRIQNNEVEAKLGPVKYLAKLLGLPEDSAVQMIICLIMMSFDTLAVALLIAGLQTMREHLAEREPKPKRGRTLDEIVAELPEDRREKIEERTAELIEEVEQAEQAVDAEPAPTAETETINYRGVSIEVTRDERSREIEEAMREAAEKIDWSEFESSLPAEGVRYLEGEEARLLQDRIEQAFAEEEEAEEVATVDAEDIARLAGLRPEAEREFIAREIPILDEHVEDDADQATIDPKDVDRDTLIGILERHPELLNEIEQIVEEDVVEELSDREKLIDLLEKNPAIIADMAGIIASQITKSDKPLGDSWLKD